MSWTPRELIDKLSNLDISGMIDNQVARKQQELAMLQRALGRCGLISFKENNEE